jgi:hypothetical protein
MRHLAVESARDLGAQFTHNPHRMVGQDGAYSVPLRDGAALWYFGDTLIGSRVPRESLWFPGGQQLGPGDMSGHGSIEKLLTNTGLVLRDRTGRHGLHDYRYVCGSGGGLKQLVPRESAEHPDSIRVWCFHGCELGNHLYLFYQAVRMLAEGPLPVNFEIVGSGLAKGDARSWDFARIPADGSTIWWDAGRPQFGCVVLRGAEEGRLFVYGVMKGADGVQRAYLARVREEEIADLTAYEYLCGPAPEWTANVAAAASIMTGMPNEMSVSWNAHLGCCLAVHSLDLTGRIVGRTAPEPWGPWSEPVCLWQVAPPELDYAIPYAPLIYAGKEHPELAEENGRVLYLTYVEFEEYFPHLVEVTLS